MLLQCDRWLDLSSIGSFWFSLGVGPLVPYAFCRRCRCGEVDDFPEVLTNYRIGTQYKTFVGLPTLQMFDTERNKHTVAAHIV